MLFAVSGLQDCPISASDGNVGSIKDFLFDDRSWKVRWMVDTGQWLTGRQVLIHPAAIAPLDLAFPVKPVFPMMTTGDTLVVSVRLTKHQIEALRTATTSPQPTAGRNHRVGIAFTKWWRCVQIPRRSEFRSIIAATRRFAHRETLHCHPVITDTRSNTLLMPPS